MALVQRIAGGVMFVVALITFLLCVTGTIGAWFAKSAVDETTLAVINTVADYLVLTIQTVDTIDSTIAGAEQTLSSLQDSLPALRTEGAAGPVAPRMQQVVSDQLLPTLGQLTSRARQLREGLGNLNQRVEELNRLPFVELPTLTGALATLDEQLDAAGAQGRSMLTAIQTRDGALFQSTSERVDQNLGQARAALTAGRARISALQAALVDIHQVLTFWSTVSTTVVSALLGIFAAGQLSLAAHAWGWMRGRR